MKYDFVFKLNSVELYRNGRWPDTPEGINQKILENVLKHGQSLQICME